MKTPRYTGFLFQVLGTQRKLLQSEVAERARSKIPTKRYRKICACTERMTSEEFQLLCEIHEIEPPEVEHIMKTLGWVFAVLLRARNIREYQIGELTNEELSKNKFLSICYYKESMTLRQFMLLCNLCEHTPENIMKESLEARRNLTAYSEKHELLHRRQNKSDK